MVITRSATGDSHVGYTEKCTGTLVVINDETRSIFCANAMNTLHAGEIYCSIYKKRLQLCVAER